MTVFCSHQDQLDHRTGGGRPSIASSWQMFAKHLGTLAHRATGRTGAAFKILHQAMSVMSGRHGRTGKGADLSGAYRQND
jgi:hypothetical protein